MMKEVLSVLAEIQLFGCKLLDNGFILQRQRYPSDHNRGNHCCAATTGKDSFTGPLGDVDDLWVRRDMSTNFDINGPQLA
ncbi:MAG: hypothetical protein AAFV46_11235, partial [Cyanobacteria bacterium J06635_11]